MRKLILLFTIIATHPVFAEEDFRPWKTFEGKDFNIFLKSLYRLDIRAGRLVGYDPAFPMEKLNLSEAWQEWLKEKGAGEKTLRVVKLTVKVYPMQADPDAKSRDKPEPKEVDQSFPLLYFSEEDQNYVLDWDWLQKRQSFFDSCLQVVLGEEREIQKQRRQPSPQHDLIILRNGSRKKGVVQNTRFALHSDYGRFEVSREGLAAVQFGDGFGGYDALIGVNNNRLSGFLDFPADSDVGTKANMLTFESDSEKKEEIRKEKIARIIFRVREDELNDLGGDSSVFVRLRNGDAFDAKVSGGQFKIGSLTVPVSDVSHIEIRAGTPTLQMKGGETEVGDFSQEDLPVELDLGPAFTVYRERLELIYCKSGFRPVGRIVEVAEERDAKLYFEKDAPFGRVKSVSSRSPFYKVLQSGDQIVSVNRRIPDFESRDNSYDLALEDLFDEQKTISHIELGIRRSKQDFFQVTIAKK